MREIKFRGKRVDNGEWHYGFFREFRMLDCWKEQAYRNGINYYIDAKGTNESHLVIPETVGQSTGLDDNDDEIDGDTEIFEGDVIEFEHEGEVVDGPVKFEAGCFIVTSDKLPDGYITLLDISDNDGRYCWINGRIVGNIYENPELLEVT